MPATALVPMILALAAAEGGTVSSPPAATTALDASPAPPRTEARPAATPTRRYQIERIRLDGLGRVRESEVRRHLLVAEGELLDEERVLLSRLKLLQLGWFSRVETRVERGSERGLVVLVIAVSERNTLIVTDLILGSTGPQPVYGGLGLSQQNFLGRGFGMSGAFVYGGSPLGRPEDPDRFAVRASFFAPDVSSRFVRRGLVLGATALFLRGEELACGDPECEAYAADYGAAPRVQYQRAMGEVTVGFRPGPFERVLGTYRFERVRASESAAAAAQPGIDPAIDDGWSTVSAITGTYEIDTRDDFFFPTEGLRALSQVTFASRVLGGDYEYSRYLLQLETAFGLLRRPLRVLGALGAVQGNAPFFDLFYPADFSYFAVGPALGRALELNFSTDSRYDAFLAMGGVEYGIPLWAGGGFFRRGYLALGVRAVWSSATPGGGRTPFSRSPASGDVALRLDTPVGVFNASLGYAVDNVL
jgi:outer membrane protein assembly factor BamA